MAAQGEIWVPPRTPWSVRPAAAAKVQQRVGAVHFARGSSVTGASIKRWGNNAELGFRWSIVAPCCLQTALLTLCAGVRH